MPAWAKGLLGTLILLALVRFTALGDSLNRAITDAHWRARAGSAPPFPPDIVVVGIDDRSVQKLGRLKYWSRARYAELLDRLSQARAVGLDLLFTEPDPYDPQGDQRLADAMKRHGRVVAPLYTWKETRPVSPETQAQEKLLLSRLSPSPAAGSLPFVYPSVLEPPIESVYRASAMPGYADVSSDPDGVYRRALLFRATEGGLVMPHLTTALAAVATGSDLRQLTSRLPDEVVFGPHRVPLEEGTLLLRPLARRGGGFLKGLGQPVPTVSFAAALRSKPEDWKDRIVLVGETATGTTDIRPNPLDAGLRGVELNAEILANLLHLPPVRPLPPAVDLGFILVAVALPLWLYSSFSAARATLLAVVFGLALVGLMEGGFWGLDLVPSWSPVLAALLGSTLLMGLQRLGQEEEQKRQIRDSFSLYVAPELVEEIVADPARARQEGTRQRVAVLFSDIRSFTSYSEQNPPELVVRQMGEYLNEMTAAVLKAGGVLDKFIGDAVMALYGPFHSGDINASARAVISGLDMLDRLDALNARWEAQGLPLFRIGIGIHVGEAIVGNIVTEHRQQFTALGDTVNLASRLQSATKDLHAVLIVSEDVKLEAETVLAKHVRFRDRGMLSVRNREQPVRVFEVTRAGAETTTQETHDVRDEEAAEV